MPVIKSLIFIEKVFRTIISILPTLKDFNKINTKQVNIYNCWEEEVVIKPGELNEIGGKYAIKSLKAATDALKNGQINGLVTAPIHKKNVHSSEFPYAGHTPFFKDYFEQKDVVMLLAAGDFRVGLANRTCCFERGSSIYYQRKYLKQDQYFARFSKKRFQHRKAKNSCAGIKSSCRR